MSEANVLVSKVSKLSVGTEILRELKFYQKYGFLIDLASVESLIVLLSGMFSSLTSSFFALMVRLESDEITAL